ncbi:MAG: hypothetical protein II365_05210 [Clostridia bacterium]|nr:hypothetical protein [Clostridia bacterium]
MIHSPTSFKGIEQKQELVASCDRNFEDRLTQIAEDICSESGLKLICLTGPTCSGKTTAAKKFISEFEKRKRRARVISIDDFYYDKEHLNKLAENDPNCEIDFDSEKTIDIEEFGRCVEEIFEGGRIKIPRFDFTLGKRMGYTELECNEGDIYIFEGIQAIYPSVIEKFGTHKYRIIYISVASPIAVGDVVFEPNEIRLMRRIVRDFFRRNSSCDYTLTLWKSVRENEERNIIPYAKSCDYHIDSAMAYEVGMLKPHLEKILTGSISGNDKFDVNHLGVGNSKTDWTTQKKQILQKLQGIEEIDSSLIHENSLYREFL